jgi:hypothetical protein
MANQSIGSRKNPICDNDQNGGGNRKRRCKSDRFPNINHLIAYFLANLLAVQLHRREASSSKQ